MCLRALPNALSALRLIIAILAVYAYTVTVNGLVIVLALSVGIVTDVLDGFIARAQNVESVLGHRLDIIADACCFGILPCVYIVERQQSRFADAVCVLFVFYGLARIGAGWRCAGIPLPLLGCLLFATYYIALLPSVRIFVAAVLIAVAFASIAIERRRRTS